MPGYCSSRKFASLSQPPATSVGVPGSHKPPADDTCRQGKRKRSDDPLYHEDALIPVKIKKEDTYTNHCNLGNRIPLQSIGNCLPIRSGSHSTTSTIDSKISVSQCFNEVNAASKAGPSNEFFNKHFLNKERLSAASLPHQMGNSSKIVFPRQSAPYMSSSVYTDPPSLNAASKREVLSAGPRVPPSNRALPPVQPPVQPLVQPPGQYPNPVGNPERQEDMWRPW